MDLKALPGSDARKVALAKFLRERTTVSLEWVARALCYGRGGERRGTTCERGRQRGSWTQLMVER